MAEKVAIALAIIMWVIAIVLLLAGCGDGGITTDCKFYDKPYKGQGDTYQCITRDIPPKEQISK